MGFFFFFSWKQIHTNLLEHVWTGPSLEHNISIQKEPQSSNTNSSKPEKSAN